MLKASLIAGLLCVSFSIAHAQYVVVLKNGGKLTVQNYREEGSMIKFSGASGEIAISRDQVQMIRRADTSESAAAPQRASLDRPPPETAAESLPAPSAQPEIKRPVAVSLDQQQAKKRAEEAKAYEDRLKDLTAQLKELRDRYSLITRGNQGPEPSFFTTEEAFKGQ